MMSGGLLTSVPLTPVTGPAVVPVTTGRQADVIMNTRANAAPCIVITAAAALVKVTAMEIITAKPA